MQQQVVRYSFRQGSLRPEDTKAVTQVETTLRGNMAAHAAGVHRHDLVIKARKAALIFGDQLMVEAGFPITGHLQLKSPAVRRQSLLTVVIAEASAGLFVAVNMMIHLGVQKALGKCFLQIVDQAIGVDDGLRIGTNKKLVNNRISDNRFFASVHGKLSPFFPLCPPRHKIADSPTWSHHTGALCLVPGLDVLLSTNYEAIKDAVWSNMLPDR